MEYKGIVTGGSAKASSLGYPTANIPLTDVNVSGIYAAKAQFGDKEYQAVVYADPVRGVLETHFFDFSENLYGKEVAVALLEKIRETKKFDDDTSLKDAIKQDEA